MKKILLGFLLIMIANIAVCQSVIKIDSDGIKLKEFYIKQDVEHLWLAGHHVNWETGEQDDPNASKNIKTHCSAFVASVCKQKGIYILRPPEHKTQLLADAQYTWLFSTDARNKGWRQIRDSIYKKAQELANSGYIVTAVYKNPSPKKPGHIALVMPAERSVDDLNREGPMIIMAGTVNWNYISFRKGFKHHISDWSMATAEIAFFYYQ